MIDRCQLQWHWGNCNSTGALGQQEAMAMGQRHCDHCHCDRSIVPNAIDHVDVDAWGAPTRSTFIPCVLIQKVSECQSEVRIKGVTYLFDYFD
jgi:hypothetical protein